MNISNLAASFATTGRTQRRRVPSIGSGALSGFRTLGGNILDSAGNVIQLRGINHFGFNAGILQPQYLWQMDWKAQIAQIKALGFNAVRLPYVPDTLYSTATVDSLSFISGGPGNVLLLGKTPLQAMDLWMAEAELQGLYVLMDYHSVSKLGLVQRWYIDNPADFPLVYNGLAYTKEHWIRDLVFVATRYAGNSRFIGIDVFNEPHGAVRWGAGDPNMTIVANYWKPAVEDAAAAILAANPNLLIFVQGTEAAFDGIAQTLPTNYGENFQPHAYNPMLVQAGKLVFTPHTYGPDVYVKSSFSAPNFPANLAAQWETQFGQFSSTVPIVTGEWGGRYGTGTGGLADKTWQDAFVNWMISKGIRSSFYWCYTPNSGDTGGILDDALNVIPAKMTLINRHWAG